MGKRYTVEETSIKATADAIREKLGNTNSIEWKNGSGFANAVGAIGTSSGGGLENGYDVTFYDEYNDGLAFYSIKQGHAINSPVYNCKAWQTVDGVNITFPYIPTEDIIIYANNNTYASELYRYYGVDSGVYPYISIEHCKYSYYIRLNFTKRFVQQGSNVRIYERLTAKVRAERTPIPVEDIVTWLQTNIQPTDLTEDTSGELQFGGADYNYYINFEATFAGSTVYRLDQ